MPETVYGVPTHLLLVHAVVVLVPLSAFGVVLMATLPGTRPVLGWPVLFVSTSALAAVPLATTAGEALLSRLVAQGGLGGPVLDKVRLHQELGELVLWPVLGMEILTVALVVLDRRRGRARTGRLLRVVAALAVVMAGLSAVQVVRAGHAGATAVWNPAG